MNETLLGGIRRRLEQNPHCQFPDLLRRERTLILEHGVMSHEGAPELLTLLACYQGFWYGHVVKVDPERFEPECTNPGPWVSIIVQAFEDVDDHTAEAVFENYHTAITRKLKYKPCYALGPDDTFRLSPSFEQACQALETMITRFDPRLAAGPMVDSFCEEIDRHPDADRARLDMRCFDLYGLSLEDPRETEPGPWDPGGVFYEAALRAEANRLRREKRR